VAAASAAPIAIRVTCQPGMPPVKTVWTRADTGPDLPLGPGRACGAAKAAGAPAAIASAAAASPARMEARRRMVRMGS